MDYNNIDKQLVSNEELCFVKENLVRTLSMTDDGNIEYYDNNKLVEVKPFSKLNVDRLVKTIVQEGYDLGEDTIKYNIYISTKVDDEGNFDAKKVDSVNTKEEAISRIEELQSEDGEGAWYVKEINGVEEAQVEDREISTEEMNKVIDDEEKDIKNENEKIEEEDKIDFNKTKQELEDNIAQVDELQQLKDELDAKVNTLFGEGKKVKTETTDKEIKKMHAELAEKERQALKDAGDPNPENTIGIAKRLPEEKWKELKHEGDILNCIRMIHSILTYGYTEDENEVLGNRYLQEFISLLGKEKVKELVKNEIEEYKQATINRDVYTDGEGVSYNSVTFKDESKKNNNTMPSNDKTKEKLSIETINEMKSIPFSEEQKQFLKSEGISEEDILEGLKDLVKQMKYTSKTDPIISIEEYVEEVLKF